MIDGIRARAKAYAEHGTPGLNATRDRADLLVIVDAQQAKLDAVAALAEKWRYKGEFGWGPWQIGDGPDETGAAFDQASCDLRAMITGEGE